jgi:hypothetical protein
MRRADVGRLRQVVRARFFRENGYLELPDSRGNVKFVHPNVATETKRRGRSDPERKPWLKQAVITAIGLFGLVIFGFVVAG